MQGSAEQNGQDVVKAADMLMNGHTFADLRGLGRKELEAIYAMGFTLYNQGKFADAEKVFTFLSFYNHLERKYFKGLGAARQMQNKYEAAVQAYTMAQILDADDPEPILRIAECLIPLGMTAEALEALDIALQDCRDKPQYAALARRAEALKGLLRAAAANPQPEGA